MLSYSQIFLVLNVEGDSPFFAVWTFLVEDVGSFLPLVQSSRFFLFPKETETLLTRMRERKMERKRDRRKDRDT